MGSAVSTESRTGEDKTAYEVTSVTVMRGKEAGTIAKWESDGWEFLTRSPGMLRTELTFRRPKSKKPAILMAVVGAALALTIAIGAIVEQGGGAPADASASTTVTADAPAEQSTAPTAPTQVETYTYSGAQYEIVAVDDDLAIGLDQYWVFTGEFDLSNQAYKDQIRLIVTDIAHRAGTDQLIVNVVTDREVAEAEAFSTYEGFVQEHGMDYVNGVVVPKEAAHWVASYTGGVDADAGQRSEAATAFEIVWWPGAAVEFENWRPALSR